MIYYFNSQNGLPATPNVDAGESLVKQGLAIKKEDVPADVETWRLSVNVETGALTVFAEGKQEADALLDKAEKDIAQAEADEVKNQADMKAQADAQKAAGTP